MPKYFLTHKAVEDLSAIWEYTYENWSKDQADKYYRELIGNCQELADNKIAGSNYVEIGDGIFGFKSGKHIIFYRIALENKIEIIRFLHSRMDLKSRIKK
jgi:toxin ParE1/3/4